MGKLKLTLQPGRLGVAFNDSTREITEVNDGLGKDLGLEVGWFILEVDGKPYTKKLLMQMVNGKEPYEAVFLVNEDYNYKCLCKRMEFLRQASREMLVNSSLDNSLAAVLEQVRNDE